MGAYACTVTNDFASIKPTGALRLRRSQIYAIMGKADITNYNQTGAEITDITDNFSTVLTVMCEGLSDNGYLVRWDRTDSCFHAFYPFYASAGSETSGANNTLTKTSTGGPTEVGGSGTAYGQPGVEVANDVDVGEVNFIAFGYA